MQRIALRCNGLRCAATDAAACNCRWSDAAGGASLQAALRCNQCAGVRAWKCACVRACVCARVPSECENARVRARTRACVSCVRASPHCAREPTRPISACARGRAHGAGGGRVECTGEVRQWCTQTLLRAGESPCSPGADVAEKVSSHAADAAVMHTNTPELNRHLRSCGTRGNLLMGQCEPIAEFLATHLADRMCQNR